MCFVARKWKNQTKVSVGSSKVIPAYQHWHHMRHRCQEPYWLKYPTYIGTSHQPDWDDYDIFHEWVTNQKGYGLDGANLDKDLLGDGTFYSEQTCCLLPRQLNAAITGGRSSKGGLYPTGVSLNGGKYMVSLAYDGKNKTLGRYNTPEEAFNVYREAKIAKIRNLAEEFKDRINERAFKALMNYDRIGKGVE